MDHTRNFLNQQLGNYRLQRLLGRGGFADVYLAEHVLLHYQAAVKVLHLKLTDAFRQDFLREASTVAQLNHPHIVRVFECDIEGDMPYQVMTYAPHGSLRQRHPRGTRLALEQVVIYVNQAASALHYAHEQKLIHRDVKPGNMLIGSQGEILLSDFGLVVVAQSTSSLQTRDIAGTAPYMAPEQFQGRPRRASDQYALAVVAYELLCGECPFSGNFVQIATQKAVGIIPSLCEKAPTVAPAVEAVIFKALAKAPEDRYPSVQSFAEALTLAANSVQSSSAIEQTIQIQDISALIDEKTFIPGVSGTLKAVSIDLDAQEQTLVRAHTPRELTPTNTVSSGDDVKKTEYALPPLPHFSPSGPENRADASISRPDVHTTVYLNPPLRKFRNRHIIAACVLLALLLLGTGALTFAHSGSPSSRLFANITITPDSKMLHETYTIQAVAGTPDASLYQVQARTLLITSPVGTKTVAASGKGHSDATYAHGTVWMCADASMAYGTTQTYSAGTTFTSNDLQRVDSEGHVLAIKITQSATVKQPADGKQYDSHGNAVPGVCQSNISAIYAYPGAVGNIAPYPDNGGTTEPFHTLTAEDVDVDSGMVSFTGGQDAQDYTFVQQSDIDSALAGLPIASAPDAQALVGKQLKDGERFETAPTCQEKTEQDHNVDDRTGAVTVTRVYSCRGQAYDYDAAIRMAAQEMRDQAKHDPGTTYLLSGQLHTMFQGATNGANSVINVTIAVSGVWIYQISDAQKQHWQQMLKGMQKSKAETFLQQQSGIKHVSIELIGGNHDVLPGTIDDINIMISTSAG